MPGLPVLTIIGSQRQQPSTLSKHPRHEVHSRVDLVENGPPPLAGGLCKSGVCMPASSMKTALWVRKGPVGAHRASPTERAASRGQGL